jgi:hypothetical protein
VEDAKEEYGWKLVHADVFRAPSTFPMVYSALIGTGTTKSWRRVSIGATLG